MSHCVTPGQLPTLADADARTRLPLARYLRSVTDEQLDAARAKMERIKCLFVYNMTSPCSAYHAVLSEAATRVRRWVRRLLGFRVEVLIDFDLRSGV